MTPRGGLHENAIRILKAEIDRLRELLEPIVDEEATWGLPEFPRLYLPKIERRILRTLHINMPRVVRRPALYDMLYSTRPEADQPETPNIMSVYVCKLRRRLAITPYRIVTHHGIGWSLYKE